MCPPWWLSWGLILVRSAPFTLSLSLMSIATGGGAAEVVVTKLLMAIIVTMAVLCCALYVILAGRYRDADRKWAYGAVGSIMGYWHGLLAGPKLSDDPAHVA